VRDGIAAAERGLPSIAFVTADFWKQGDFVAKAQGMPDIPRIKLPHPVAGTGQEAMAKLAEDIMANVLTQLKNGAK
jgi:hypothetical protein